MRMVQTIGIVAGGLMIVAAVAAALPVVASDTGSTPAVETSSWLSVAEVAQKVEAMGYRVLEVERDDGRYEVKALDAEGRKVEAYVHPTTGEILKTERK